MDATAGFASANDLAKQLITLATGINHERSESKSSI